MSGMENNNIINNDNWWETFDGILWKLEQLRDENIALKEEIEKIKKSDNGETNV